MASRCCEASSTNFTVVVPTVTTSDSAPFLRSLSSSCRSRLLLYPLSPAHEQNRTQTLSRAQGQALYWFGFALKIDQVGPRKMGRQLGSVKVPGMHQLLRRVTAMTDTSPVSIRRAQISKSALDLFRSLDEEQEHDLRLLAAASQMLTRSKVVASGIGTAMLVGASRRLDVL